MDGSTAVIVLAAGEGKRLKSDLPKVLHRVAGRSLLGHVLAALEEVRVDRRIAVVSSRRDDIASALEEEGLGLDVELVVQDPPRGTGDAVRIALEALAGDIPSHVLVLPGDGPMIKPVTLNMLLDEHVSSGAKATVLTAIASDPSGYGRVVRRPGGEIERIVEERDATSEELGIDEINSSMYVFDTTDLGAMLEKADRENAQGEHYLTDVIGLLRSNDEKVALARVVMDEVRGTNTRAELAEVAALLRTQACDRLMFEGVTIVDPATTYIDPTVEVGRDATILPFTFLEGRTVVGEGAEIGPQVRIVDSEVGERAKITYAVVRGSVVGPEASVGPFASLRPGSKLGRGAEIGTFVETKNTVLGDDSDAHHLAYLGDAKIGSGVNIGAGTITCNWDGEKKNRTVIEDDAYISSDTMLVAPVHIGKRAATGAGAVVREDVPDDALAVGVPARVIEGKGNRMKRSRRSRTEKNGGDTT
ncbi:MAG: bifunctional UDP-N-acetylglucosamine diphosphorylase/glucosamine-1-phosphate N-acetyltransferase GlmU [Actinomycetota bacterium]